MSKYINCLKCNHDCNGQAKITESVNLCKDNDYRCIKIDELFKIKLKANVFTDDKYTYYILLIRLLKNKLPTYNNCAKVSIYSLN